MPNADIFMRVSLYFMKTQKEREQQQQKKTFVLISARTFCLWDTLNKLLIILQIAWMKRFFCQPVLSLVLFLLSSTAFSFVVFASTVRVRCLRLSLRLLFCWWFFVSLVPGEWAAFIITKRFFSIFYYNFHLVIVLCCSFDGCSLRMGKGHLNGFTRRERDQTREFSLFYTRKFLCQSLFLYDILHRLSVGKWSPTFLHHHQSWVAWFFQ